MDFDPLNKQNDMTPREAIEAANNLLKANGFTIFGEPAAKGNYLQNRFENRMQTGAYRKCDGRR
jgi:hypothetical protein